MTGNTPASTTADTPEAPQSGNDLTGASNLAQALAAVGQAVTTDVQLLAVLTVGILVIAVPAVYAVGTFATTPTGAVLGFLVWFLSVALISGLFMARFLFKTSRRTERDTREIQYNFRRDLIEAQKRFARLQDEVDPSNAA
jgi:membrane protein implicated in regulation of membrane protease activity